MARIFISYRRSDSKFATTTIFEKLCESFGEANVFMDVEGILKGRDFRSQIEQAVESCDVVLAVMGPDWASAESASGSGLDDPDDYVRLELESALKRGVPVIPTVIDDAAIPKAKELPEPLQDLVYRNASRVRSGRDFAPDLKALCRDIKETVDFGQAPEAVVEVSEGSAESGATKRKKSTKVVITTVLIALACAVGFFVFQYFLVDDGPPFEALVPLQNPEADWYLSVNAPDGTLLDFEVSVWQGSEAIRVGEFRGRLESGVEGHYSVPGDFISVSNVVSGVAFPGLSRISIEGTLLLPDGKKITVNDFSPYTNIGDGNMGNISIDPRGNIEVSHFGKACPWIFVEKVDGSWEKRVEIIQNLNNKGAEASQRVSLGRVIPVEDGMLRMEVREEKAEISFLDQIFLQVEDANHEIFPVKMDRLSKIDGNYLKLEEGDAVGIEFHDPSLRAGVPVEIEIIATGYYITLPD